MQQKAIIKWRIISIELDSPYTLWDWFMRNISSWLDRWYKFWKLKSKKNKNIVWKWYVVPEVKLKDEFWLNIEMSEKKKPRKETWFSRLFFN